nr:gamma-tocopherol methyltransferase [Colletotrichum truncatum]KAF6783486.1 gamma-tocopherol methyltransferase [Colletotrichum truncatum]
MAATVDNSATSLSQQYETPLGLAHSTMQALKDRIKLHYDLASDYYLSLWGEHIHHGYWENDSQTKEEAQVNLIQLLLKLSGVSENSVVLDVGCGIGGTSRYLASTLGCSVTGITISTKQVEIANRLTRAEAEKDQEKPDVDSDADGFFKLGRGKVRFIELDAEKMGDFFAEQGGSFDAVWISEALSHFPNKALFFENTFKVLRPGGKLALADWFKAEGLNETDFNNDIKPIEGSRASIPMGQLCCPLYFPPQLTHFRWHASPSSLHPNRLRGPGQKEWTHTARRAQGH